MFPNKNTETHVNHLKKNALEQTVTPCSNYKREEQKRNTKFKSRLNLYYKIEVADTCDVDQLKRCLLNSTVVENIIETPAAISLSLPNDVSSATHHNDGAQYFFNKHTFQQAWEVEKGNPNVKIGIVDTGTRFSHKDLKNNLAYNTNDPIDKKNNDNDYGGENNLPLTDNYNGWDLADWDNDPSALPDNVHGTCVTGIAAASTNNGYGGVGAAYMCRYIPYKVSYDSSPNNITHGYLGIIMAAEQGCRVINASWGKEKALLSQATIAYYQEVINYVTLDLNAVVVAAAGNTTGDEVEWIPAALDNVISVTAVSLGGSKLNKATFNSKVDICAQGWNNYTTNSTSDSAFITFTGTSSAAPVVSGAVALLVSKFPKWTSAQIAEQIITTCDVVDTLPNNLNFKGKMGGYLNPYKALTTFNPGISISAIQAREKRAYEIGETVELDIVFKQTNPLYQGITISVKSDSEAVVLNEFEYYVSANNNSDEFTQATLSLKINRSTTDTLQIPLSFFYENDAGLSKAENVIVKLPISRLTSIHKLASTKTKKTFIESPILDELIIHLPDNQITEICIYDILGNQVIQQPVLPREQLIIIDQIYSKLKSGLYILELKNVERQVSPLKFYIP